MYSLLTEPVTRLSLVRFGLLPQARPLQGDVVPDASLSSRRDPIINLSLVLGHRTGIYQAFGLQLKMWQDPVIHAFDVEA